MSDFQKNWETLKKNFSTTVLGHLKKGGDAVPADVKRAVVELVKTETGFTPALKEVDDAFGKRHRATVMKALTKVHMVVEKNTKLFQRAAVDAMNASNENANTSAGPILLDIASCIKEFNTKVITIETGIAKALESLQESKGDGAKINIISLEGDMKGAVDKFKKDIKVFAAGNEKKFKSITILEKLAKSMRKYSDAAARTKVTDARVALEEFFKGVDEFENYSKQVPKTTQKVYIDACEKLTTALKAIKNTRGQASLKNLKELEVAAK